MEKSVQWDNPKNKLSMNQKAAELLSAAFVDIFNNTDLRKFCENHLERETARSLKRKEIYDTECKHSWQRILWCFCSLNSKGSAKASREKWCLKFSLMSDLINPEVLYTEFNGNEEKIFCAMNLILRNFAGGRFLTISKKYYGEQYNGFDNIEIPTEEDLIKIVSANTSGLLSKNNSHNTASFKLFEIFKKNEFKVESINKSFNNLNIISISVDDLIERFSSYGINNKFARNIKMDILADNIDGYFAIDSRIQTILESIGYPAFNINKDYHDIELFLNTILKEEKFLGKICFQYKNKPNNSTKMTSWELDRLMFSLSDSNNNILRLFLPANEDR
jgi:hypothetical protein